MRARGIPVVPVLVLLMSVACSGDDAAPQSLIAEARVLAVRAEPPSLSLGDVARLDALVVDRAGIELAPDVAWRACDPWAFTLDPDVDCSADASLPLDGALDPAAVFARFPPPGGTAPETPGGEDELCATDAPTLALPVVAEVWVDGERLVALKRIPFSAGGLAEANPAVGDIAFDGERAPATFEPGQNYALALTALVAGRAPRCDGEPARLTVNVYTTDGDVDDGQVAVMVPTDPTDPVPVTSWRAPRGPHSVLWILAIDGNGGVAWTRHELLRR